MTCCAVCGREETDEITIHRCSRCHAEPYCNIMCQRKGWKTHKLVCTPTPPPPPPKKMSIYRVSITTGEEARPHEHIKAAYAIDEAPYGGFDRLSSLPCGPEDKDPLSPTSCVVSAWIFARLRSYEHKAVALTFEEAVARANGKRRLGIGGEDMVAYLIIDKLPSHVNQAAFKVGGEIRHPDRWGDKILIPVSEPDWEVVGMNPDGSTYAMPSGARILVTFWHVYGGTQW